MKKFMRLYYDNWTTPKKGDYPEPCYSIEGLTYGYSERRGMGYNLTQSSFMILVHFPNFPSFVYLQTVQVQAYDFERLVGNIGGYIGLFLGYSFLQIPHLMEYMYSKFRNQQKRSDVFIDNPKIQNV